jgi:hypothetical protein
MVRRYIDARHLGEGLLNPFAGILPLAPLKGTGLSCSFWSVFCFASEVVFHTFFLLFLRKRDRIVSVEIRIC